MSAFRICVGVALAALCQQAPCHAAQPPEPVHLEYRAFGSCPDASEFLKTVAARVQRENGIRVANSDEWARTLRVSITDSGERGVNGEFTVAGQSEIRTVSGESCATVFEALALFAALTLDPGAALAPPQRQTPAAPVATVPRGPEPDPTPRQERATVIRGLLGGHVGVMSSGTPARSLLLEPFVELGLHAIGRRGVAFAPALRLTFTAASADTRRVDQGFAELSWLSLRVDACPLELRAGERLTARPCFAASGGSFHVDSQELDRANDYRLSWWTVGSVVRGELRVVGMLGLEADAGFDVPLARARLFIEPDSAVYATPLAIARLRFGLSLQFP